jgi:hypothetical protein
MKAQVFDKSLIGLRRRMKEDMAVRRFGEKTQADYIRHVKNFVKFLGRSPETATGEDLRRYQVHQVKRGVHLRSSVQGLGRDDFGLGVWHTRRSTPAVLGL